MDEGKITSRQLSLIFILAASIPTARICITLIADSARADSWMTPLVGAVLYLPFLWVIVSLMRWSGDRNFSDALGQLIGRPLSAAVMVLYLLWITVNAGFYLRLFGDTVAAVMFPQTNHAVFIAAMAFAVLYAVKRGLGSIARASVILFFIVIAIQLFFFLGLLGQVEKNNLTPVLTDPAQVGIGGAAFTSVLCTMATALFLSDCVSDRGRLRRSGWLALGGAAALMCLTVLIPLGMFGWEIVSEMGYPVFGAVKELSFFDMIEHMESIFLISVMIGYFVSTSVCVTVGLRIFSRLTRCRPPEAFANLYMVLLFLFAVACADSSMELSRSFRDLLLPANLLFGGLFPVIFFVTGKIRKKI